MVLMRIDVKILISAAMTLMALAVCTPAVAHQDVQPNDAYFERQWADLNVGQLVPEQQMPGEQLGASTAGAVDADDDAAAAWQVTTGSASIVVGETDTGVDYEHPDLAANIWTNPGGIGGCPAGTHGYDVLSKGCDPMDDDTVYGGHGTHVAGIVGAVGNNGIGVAGVNWHASILPVKWLNSEAWGETAGLIEALQWILRVKQEGVNVRVVDDSATFAGTTYSQALSDEIDTLGANGILFVTSAGNTGQNDDEASAKRYPCGYDRPTEICVTASDDEDELPSWANYGEHTVDLAAPGVSIFSTLRGDAYGYLSGGSMAAPAVAGAAALILSVEPALSPQQLKNRILESVAPVPALADKLASGGILDICQAIAQCREEGQTVEETPTETHGSMPPGDEALRPPKAPTPAGPAVRAPAPAISGLTLLPRRFVVAASRARRGSIRRRGGGGKISYVDAVAGRTVLSFSLERPGVMSAGGRCVSVTGIHRGRTCMRWVKIGTLVHADRAGRNLIDFSGRLGGRGLAPGSYRLLATPMLANSAGRAGSTSFFVISARSA